VRDYSSLPSFCLEADPVAICEHPKYKEEACKDGKFEFSREYACGLYPEKCELGTDKTDICAISWVDCLLDRSWNFCDSFPEMCIAKVEYHYKDISEVGAEICKQSKDVMCDGAEDKPTNQTVVCDNLDLLTGEVMTQSSLGKFCEGRPFDICKDPSHEYFDKFCDPE
jgi:hypothetical protein